MRDAAAAPLPLPPLQAWPVGLQARELIAAETSLLAEVEELGRAIANAKAEIAALQVDDINASHIPLATDELDAIVAHTAAATDSILGTCETLDRLANELGNDDSSALSAAASARLRDATTRIYEACGFQDITGQRITKVVAALKLIETKVAHMIDTFSVRGVRAADAVATSARVGGEAMLLNGPQLPTAAMDQNDIDKLLASFD